MLRPAEVSAARMPPRPGPLCPVTVTRWTATSDEVRSHSHPPPSRRRARAIAASASRSLLGADRRVTLIPVPIRTGARLPPASAPRPRAVTPKRSPDPPAALGHQRNHLGGGRVASLTMKFACFSEKPAPPIRSPLAPAASSNCPAVRPSALGSDRVLERRAERLDPYWLRRSRRARMSASVALTCSASDGRSAKHAWATTSVGARLDAR